MSCQTFTVVCLQEAMLCQLCYKISLQCFSCCPIQATTAKKYICFNVWMAMFLHSNMYGVVAGSCALPVALQGANLDVISDAQCESLRGTSFQSSNMICVWDTVNQQLGACNVSYITTTYSFLPLPNREESALGFALPIQLQNG